MWSGPLGNPKIWVPNIDTKDCSQGICSFYCPQWCYTFFPPPQPPPPPPPPFPEENSSPKFSPLTIAIIVILASAFLLVTYYAIIFSHCRKKSSSTREENQDYPSVEMEENYQFQDPPNDEPLWYVAANGLDEAFIKSIAVCKFKKGDGLIECTDCSVCLSKFEEDESLRLLPKCSHAFHVNCIDTWLRSHSNCPLCRANIETSVNVEALSEISNGGNGNGDVEDREIEERDDVIEIGEEGGKQIRRSMSMDSSSRQGRVWMSNMNQDDEELQMESMSKSSHRNKVSSVAIKRSFSSGRFSFGGHGRGGIIVMAL